MTLVDVGAGTGAFATALHDWFGLSVVAVEPSAAMRDEIPRTHAITVLAGDAEALPLPERSADAAWISLVLHHIADLRLAARELRRVLRPDAPVLIRQGFPGRVGGVELVRWFPETARIVETYPSVEETCEAFTTEGFRLDALEEVCETYPGGFAELYAGLDTFRRADTTMRSLTEDEFRCGKERLRRAMRDDDQTRTNRLDLMVLR
jgi:ubiquinone/menaquinone biosynthesis C-methylase UbiE